MQLSEFSEEVARRFSTSGNGLLPARPIKGLLVLRQHEPTAFEAFLYEPVLCLVLQGSKQVVIGERSFSLGVGECLLVSHDLPVRSRITSAPYQALVLELELATLRAIHLELADLEQDDEHARTAAIHRVDAGLLDALHRYLAVADSPADTKVLGPLISKEIHYRLLVAPIGAMLRSLIRRDSAASAISRAIASIRSDIRLPLAVPSLARQVGMSVSSFHKHFRAITSTTPLQYQKELRLLEARQRLRAGGTTVTTAALDVGYESPSQFSREYTRKFGAPPSQHLASANDEGLGTVLAGARAR
jgi:AraC-like DNA-binding protein